MLSGFSQHSAEIAGLRKGSHLPLRFHAEDDGNFAVYKKGGPISSGSAETYAVVAEIMERSKIQRQCFKTTDQNDLILCLPLF